MGLEEEIVEWSATRPPWQQRALRALAGGTPIRDEEVQAIARDLANDIQAEVPPVVLGDLPGGGESGDRVILRAVQAVEHVNALLDGQELSFGPKGLTVVYGDNASGKSGYARLLKQVVRARHQEDVLTDIFEDRSTDVPAALISYDVAASPHAEQWPGETDPALGRISYYDEACGDEYITTDSAVTYRPSSLVILDGLIRVCDSVRDVLDAMLVTNGQRRIQLPVPAEGTQIRSFLEHLSGATTSAEIDDAFRVPDNVDGEIAALLDEEARLRASDPARERARLSQLASHLATIADHMASLETQLDDEVAANLTQTQGRAIELRTAVDVASTATFESEPVAGVGTETWRSLWEVARRYSEAEAYPDKPFPVTDLNARCVLCQQELSSEADDRFHRFHAFMSDDTERRAAEAQRLFETAVQTLRSLVIEPAPVAVALAAVTEHDPSLADRCVAAFAALEARNAAMLARIEDRTIDVPDLPQGVVDNLRSAAGSATEQASTIDASEVQRLIDDVSKKRMELEGRREAAASRAEIDNEVARLAERAKIELAKRQTDTTGITRKSTELARDHVTAVVRDRFTRESHDLKLRRLTLQDIGGRKGQLMHRPAFLGASQKAEIPDVLSEGEQTALGLAGFLTEAFFDETKSAIVLDDPVSSLDHIRRSHVAARLAEFATDRQVIVFTHDVSFVGDLRRAADHAQIEFTERCVELRGDGAIGYCTEQHPWKARDAKARLGQLEAELARIKRERENWHSETYDKEVADWAGRVSETWERIINLDIVNRVVDRGTAEVRPKMFRMLARITDDDDREFQESYGRCSQWARRHDKSPDINYVAPDIAQLEAELALVRAWHDRIRRYGD